MFTGIIESLGQVADIQKEKENLRFRIKSSLINELKIDQSIAHNGACLTIEKINDQDETYEVVAIKETLEKTNLAQLKEGEFINLERCMQINARIDGHIVQGHVDAIAVLTRISEQQGSWQFDFELLEPSKLIVEKGSICVNGVSLTAFNIDDSHFSVAIIPYTYEHTIFKDLKEKMSVNIEFDIIGKYVQRLNA